MKKKYEYLNNVKCPYCGYFNSKENAMFYGTCTRCRKTLDEKVKFKYEMNKKLRLWRGKFK